jgi:hypothetical protein
MATGGNVRITGGQQLGVVGRTGVSLGPHLYFAILRNGQAVDPAPLLGLPLCNGGRAPGSARIPHADDAPLDVAVSNDEPLSPARSALLDDFPPIRGCSVDVMIRIAARQSGVERGGGRFGRTGITRYTCPAVP